ncbi:MAG: chorismate-binding protein, partial [Cetobacterium sp.]|nr:chorismate-binding protein [Cetobacterium sp.]
GVFKLNNFGELDVALVLRSAFQNNKESWLRVGAGIVSMSNPERELEETKEKISSVLNQIIYEED